MNNESKYKDYYNLIRDGNGNDTKYLYIDNVSDLKSKVESYIKNGSLNGFCSIKVFFKKKGKIEKVRYISVNNLDEDIRYLEEEEKEENTLEKVSSKVIIDIDYSIDDKSILIYSSIRKKVFEVCNNEKNENALLSILYSQIQNFYNLQYDLKDIKLYIYIDLPILIGSASLLTIGVPMPIYICIVGSTIAFNILYNKGTEEHISQIQSPYSNFYNKVMERREKEQEKKHDNNEKNNTEIQRLGPPNINCDINPKQKIIQ